MKQASKHIATQPSSSLNGYKVQAETTLIQFLMERFPQKSTTSIKSLLQHRCVSVNAIPVTKATWKLVIGDCVQIISEKNRRFQFQHPKLEILFEDEALIVVHKASGLHSVDATHGGIENAADLLQTYIRRKYPDNRIYVVHRLDRDTSGVLIFAKTRHAQNQLVKTWNESVLERKYVAIAEGQLIPLQGTIDSYLYEDNHKVVHSTHDSSRGQRAITHYEVTHHTQDYSRVLLELETGRTNQIRVHLQSLGHPIAGDAKYRASTNPLNRLALHALNIRFRHPISHRMMAFQAPEPECFRDLMQLD